MSKYEEYKKIFDEHNGVIRTSEFQAAGYHHKILKELVDQGIIVKIKRGYYEWQNEEFVSDATIITRLFPDAVIYLISSLFIYGYIDRTPNEWHLAVVRGSARPRFNIDYPKVKPYYIDEKFMSIGKTKDTYEGQEINIFDRDRTICDVIRNSNKIDKELVNQAVMNYVNDPKKNTSNLMKYAKKMRAEKKVKTIVGMWL
ncbi:MAG: type IV toxin-antitoxin system AbiEi family antitoxin domain-containing protein [Halanaerobiales bacterium]|nr:type IV toxin-antitoxin system AbiEi family antitoxin domain-containing protein [Halanaerobiales bacterium]